MARDKTTEQIFCLADDSLKAVWGLHRYTNAAVSNAPQENLLECLPEEKFRMMHHWYRLYNPEALVGAMKRAYTPLHCRLSLALLVSIFEEAAYRFRDRLHSLKKTSAPSQTYKPNLLWVLRTVKNSSPGDSKKRDARKMWKRLRTTCGEVDNARRLRDAWAQNRRYTNRYRGDAIRDGWVKLNMEKRSIPDNPIKLTNPRFENFFRSHLELIHILHTVIQIRHFDSQGFDSAREHKGSNWQQILA